MAFSTGGQNLVCSGVSFNISLVAAIRASVKALRSSGLSLAWEASCAYAEPATKRTVTSPTTVFNIGISVDVYGVYPSNMQDHCWLQRNTKELNFESTLTRSRNSILLCSAATNNDPAC